MPPSSPTNENLDKFEFTFELGDQSLVPAKNAPPMLDYVIQKYEDETEPLPKSLTKFPSMFGRTYQAFKDGIWHQPNDSHERERESCQFQILHSLLGNRLHLAPISKEFPPEIILDFGTGMGDWAIAIGDEYPETRVFGFDISPHQPELVPPNVHFLLQDMTEPWNFDLKIDYIHTRITGAAWGNFRTEFLDEAFKCLKPGGWVESQEVAAIYDSPDGSLPADSPICTWIEDMNKACTAVGRNVDWIENMKQLFRDAGFVDVHERVFRLPINTWPSDLRLKRVGEGWRNCITEGLSSFSLHLFASAFGRSQETTELMLAQVRRALMDPHIHAFNNFHVVWGRKPHPGEVEAESSKGEGSAKGKEV